MTAHNINRATTLFHEARKPSTANCQLSSSFFLRYLSFWKLYATVNDSVGALT